MKRLCTLLSALLLLSASAILCTAQNTVVPNARLTGAGQVPSGSTLTIKSGATFTIEGGGTVTGMQATDAELTAIAGLTSAADKGILFTGSGTASLLDISPVSQTFLGYTTAADWRNAIFPTTGAEGDLITHDGTNWIRLPIGTTGQVPVVQADGSFAWDDFTVAVDAADVAYDPTASGMTATDVQAAIDELDTALATKGDASGPASSTDNAIARYDSTTGKLLQDSTTTLSDAGAFAFADDIEQLFNPGSTNAGFNVGSIAGDPSAPNNGALWYDSTAGELTARIAGANVALGAGGGGMTNPMTTSQDLIVGGSSGTPGRLGVGSDGQVLKVTAGAVGWGADSTGSGSLPGTPTTGDITYYDGASWASLAIGTAGQVLKTNAGATAPEWGAASGGAALYVGRSAKTSAYTVVAGDKGYLIDCTSGTFSISLTAAATLGDGFFVSVYNSGTGTITLDPNSTEQIRDGASSATTKLLAQGDGVVLFCNGSAWYSVSSRYWYAISAGRISTDNELRFESVTDSTAVSNGSVATAGGLGVAKRLNVGGLAIFSDTTAATTTADGSIRVAGGLSVAGALLSQRYVRAQTTTTLPANRSTTIFINEGASSMALLALPAAAAGIQYTFVVQDADGLRVTAASGDTIRIAGTVSGAAGYVESTTIGNTLTLIAINATEWIATSVNGTWTFSP